MAEHEPTQDPTAIGFLINDPAGGVAMYRAAQPAELLRRAGSTVVVSDVGQMTPAGTFALGLQTKHMIAWEPDIVIFTGLWPRDVPPDAVDELRANGQRVFADCDDLPWIPTNNQHHDVALAGAKLRMFNRCDGLLVSTDVLAERLRARVHVPVHVCRNVVDLDRFDNARQHNEQRPRRRGRAITIGYRGGTGFHHDDIMQLRGILPDFLYDRADGVRFVHIGHTNNALTFAELAGVHPDYVDTRPLVPFAEYPDLLAGIDLAVVPLADAPFSHAKSALGGMEWTAAGVPWIASPTAEYLRLDPTCPRRPQTWRRRLDALVTDAELRAELHRQQRDRLHELAGTMQDDTAAASWVHALEIEPAPGAEATGADANREAVHHQPYTEGETQR